MHVPSPGGEDPLEAEVAIHSSILAWEDPKGRRPGGLQSRGSVGHDRAGACRERKASERSRSKGHVVDAQETWTPCMLMIEIGWQGHTILKAVGHCGPFWLAKQ